MESNKFKIEDGILVDYTGDDEIIEIPVSVSIIGKAVFKEKSAKKLIISNSVKIIGKEAFLYSKIDEIIMNDGVLIIEERAFWGAKCNKIIFSKNLIEIQGGAFGVFEVKNSEKIELPETIRRIGNYAFGFSKLQVALPQNIKEIEESIYAGTEIKEIRIPSKINIIPEYSFGSCKNLERVVIENATKDLNKYIDYDEDGNVKIETITSTTKIGEEAFSRCERLKEVIFPNTITEIGKMAFFGCDSLKKVNIITTNENCLNIASDSFKASGLEELDIFSTGCLNIQDGMFMWKDWGNLNKIKIIGTENSKINIGIESFKDCSNLKTINIVTEGRVNINIEAFEYCSDLEEVHIIADGGINIGESAFEHCHSLKILNIQSKYGEIRIESGAFESCNLLHTINIKSLVETLISKRAFYYCESLKTINCDGTISLMDSIPISDCTQQEIIEIINNPIKIYEILNSKNEEYNEKQNIYEDTENNKAELFKKEQIEKILKKLEQINESIQNLSDDNSDYSISLNSDTVEDIIEGIWDIL